MLFRSAAFAAQGHVQQALESPHANHVLQRAINLLAPSSVRFILDELMQCVHPVALARHPFGCRVLQRLIEHFPPEWLEQPLREILQEAYVNKPAGLLEYVATELEARSGLPAADFEHSFEEAKKQAQKLADAPAGTDFTVQMLFLDTMASLNSQQMHVLKGADEASQIGRAHV